MKEAMKMFFSLLLTTCVCSLLLASVYELSKEQIELQKLKYTVGPALKQLLKDITNDPLKDKRKIAIKGNIVNMFIGKRVDKINNLVIETFSKGYGGSIEVLTAFDIENNICKGIAIGEHKETPGIGAQITESSFRELFKGLSIESKVALKKDGGVIDGISGATISSRAVCRAVAEAIEIYKTYSDSLKGSLNNERNN